MNDTPTVTQTPTSIAVEAHLDAPPDRLFAILADPGRHSEIDGSGMVRAAAGTEPVTAVGEVFLMEMHQPALGDYRTENHVLAFEIDRLIAWRTGREGNGPVGARWTWELMPAPDGGTDVVHRYDWSEVTDPGVLARVSFPRVQPDQLSASVVALGRAAGDTPA